MQADEVTARTVGELRSLGVRLTVDDFGSGSASLVGFRERPVDGIKIDRRFLSGLPEDEVSFAVVAAISSMGTALGATVTAKGVETEAQLGVAAGHGLRARPGFPAGQADAPAGPGQPPAGLAAGLTGRAGGSYPWGVADRKTSPLGEFIRRNRELSEYSMRQFAELVGISNPYLSQIERGLRAPSEQVVQSIADALKVSADTLYEQAGVTRDGDEASDTIGGDRGGSASHAPSAAGDARDLRVVHRDLATSPSAAPDRARRRLRVREGYALISWRVAATLALTTSWVRSA